MILKWLLRAWLACLVAVVAGGVMRGEDLALTLLGVLFVLAVALVATPAVLLVIDPAREPRRSAIGSGIANLLASVWIWTLPGRPLLFTAAAIVLAALGAVVIGRSLTGARPAPTPSAPLHHRSGTLTGVVTIFLLVIGYAKTFGGHPRWGHPSAGTMTSDLKNLVALEDQYFSLHHRYGTLTDLAGYEPTMSRATITVAADSAHFVATATSTETKMICLVWSGSRQVPTDSVHGAADGMPVCWEP
jgi:hypothetical protein